jgi:hypothetical protein
VTDGIERIELIDIDRSKGDWDMNYVWHAVKGLIILALILAGLHLWPDEDLSSDLQRWRAHGPGGSVTAQNYHFGVYGMLASADQDPFVAGREVVERYITFGYAPTEFENGLELSEELYLLCTADFIGCNPSAEEEIRILEEMEAQHAELITRYLMLHAVQDFSYPMQYSWSAPFPPYRAVFAAQRLVLARIIERALSDDAAGVAWAWETLASQIAVHRRFLANAEGLVDKMLIEDMVKADIEAYAFLIEAAGGQGGQMPPILPSRLSIAERSMMTVFRNEASMAEFSDEDQFWDAAIENNGGADFESFFAQLAPFQFNATVNRMADYARISAELSLLPADEFHARIGELDDVEASYWDWIVNPIGTILVNSLLEYSNTISIYTMHDTDARIVLLQVMARARNERVSADGMDAFLDSLGPGLRSPYDGSAAIYADGMLSFQMVHGDETNTYPVEFAFTPGS